MVPQAAGCRLGCRTGRLLLLLHAALLGLRVGEATHPGPAGHLSSEDTDDALDGRYSAPGGDAFSDGWDFEAAADEQAEHSFDDPEGCEEFEEPCEDDDWQQNDGIRELPNLVPAWKGDLGFADAQLHAWRAAELIAGLAAATGAARGKKAVKQAAISVPQDADTAFVASKTFQGQWLGWSFGTTEIGTGYHRCVDDAKLLTGKAPVALNLDMAIPLRACTQSLMHQVRHESNHNVAKRKTLLCVARIPTAMPCQCRGMQPDRRLAETARDSGSHVYIQVGTRGQGGPYTSRHPENTW